MESLGLRFVFCLLAWLLSWQLCRNVLVSAIGLSLVKLSDLGLARTLEASGYYKKASSDKVSVQLKKEKKQ